MLDELQRRYIRLNFRHEEASRKYRYLYEGNTYKDIVGELEEADEILECIHGNFVMYNPEDPSVTDLVDILDSIEWRLDQILRVVDGEE